jgi:2Fe-2S ferredoxin
MPKVTIEPVGLTIEAEVGSTIMVAARPCDLFWPTTCGGQGICTTCACSTGAGEENLVPMGRSEWTPKQ